jgi:hypothetical protein
MFLKLFTNYYASHWQFDAAGRKQIADGVLCDMTDDGYLKVADFGLEVKKSRFFGPVVSR